MREISGITVGIFISQQGLCLVELVAYGVRVWTGVIWLRVFVPVVGSCEHGNEPSVSMKCEEILDYLSEY
jgi:hypothetical protein